MSGVLERTRLMTLLDDARRIQRQLQTFDYALCSEDEAVAAVRANEQLRRGAETVDHALLATIEQLGIPARSGLRTTAQWMREALIVDIHEATGRVRAAKAAGPRRSLVGEPLAPTYPAVAAAQADGVVGAKQARVITSMLDKLPDSACEHIPEVEQRLVTFAAQFEAIHLDKLAARERDHLDQDGKYRDVEQRRRARGFQVTVRPDGSCTFRGEGTAEFGEYAQVIFDAFAAPHAESNGIKDPRTAAQRRHDALLDAMKIVVGSGSLPTTGGVLATVVLTMTAEAYASGEGFAVTGHDALVPVKEAMRWAGGDYRLMITALNSAKAVVAYSSTHRLFTEGQRLALIARDQGCCFPGCTAPPGWTQTHHVTEWQDSRRTTVDDGCLLCGYHHREFERLGWTVTMSDGRPEWVPPRFIDPDQRPIRT